MPPALSGDKGDDRDDARDSAERLHHVNVDGKPDDHMDDDASSAVDIILPPSAPSVFAPGQQQGGGEDNKQNLFNPPSYPPPPSYNHQSDHDALMAKVDKWPDVQTINFGASSSSSAAAAASAATWSASSSSSSSTIRSGASLAEHNHLCDNQLAWYSVRPSITTPSGSAAATRASTASPAPSATAGNITPVSSASSSTATDSELPHLPLADFESAKPWPNALFSPRSMQWFVIAKKEDMVRGGAAQAGPSTGSSDSRPLYETHEVELGDSELANPISTAVISTSGRARQRTVWPGPWKEHRDITASGSSILSTVIPSSIPRDLLIRLKTSRMSSPAPGQTGVEAFVGTMKVLVRILYNAGRNDTRVLPLASRTITNKLGYDDIMRELLLSCGMIQTATGETEQPALKAPGKDADLTLRNLLEVVVWFQHNRPSGEASLGTEGLGFSIAADRTEPLPHSLSLLDPSITWQDRDFVSRDVFPSYNILGASTQCPDLLLSHLYHLNKSRAPDRQHLLFDALCTIQGKERKESDVLRTLVGKERSEGLFTRSELSDAYGDLGVSPSVDIETVAAAYHGALDKSANSLTSARHSREQLRIISSSRGNPEMLTTLLEQPIVMSSEEAYRVLGVEKPEETNDDFVGFSYISVLADAKEGEEKERVKEALRVVAEGRGSSHLKNVLENKDGDDGGEVDNAAGGGGVGSGGIRWGRADLPAGLNNIAMTCYLNSVLQYLFALKPLREKVLQAGANANATVDAGESSTAAATAQDLRIGGRAVTPYEVERSNKFVAHLAQLFDAMMTSPAAAVTPERELAYLALVSARVEEVEQAQATAAEAAQSGGERKEDAQSSVAPSEPSKNDSKPIDAQAAEAQSLPDLPSSKQPRLEATPGMDLDKKASTKDAEAQVDSRDRSSPSASAPPLPAPPALPPRPPTGTTTTGTDTPRRTADQRMKLGAQQDVSECLDNVIFQLQVALGEEEIARLFTGKERQRVARSGSSEAEHVKEEIFTVLAIQVPEQEEERDIYDGLDGYFNEEVVPSSTTKTDDSATTTLKRTLLDPPPILQIQLSRAQYDVARGGAYKSQAHLEAYEDLYLDRYLDATEGELPEDDARRQQAAQWRREMVACRARLEELRGGSAGGSSTVVDTLRKTSSALDSLVLNSVESDDTPLSTLVKQAHSGGLAEFLSKESGRVNDQVEDLQRRVREIKRDISALWRDAESLRYRLVAVFQHRGQATHGHHWVEMRGPRAGSAGSGKWFKYNDAVVSKTTAGDILKQDKATGATPYLLCYVREDVEEEVFESVCRRVEGLEGLEESSGGEGGGGGGGAGWVAGGGYVDPTVEATEGLGWKMLPKGGTEEVKSAAKKETVVEIPQPAWEGDVDMID